MAAGKKFSLGGALFGGQPADDHAEPQATAPDSWPLAEEAGAEGLRSLLSANRGTRDYVLKHAPKATRTVTLVSGVELAEWQRRLESAGASLLIRGAGLNTGLRLEVEDPHVSTDCLDTIAPWLQGGAGAVVTAFTLSWGTRKDVVWEDEETYEQCLTSAIAALPSLRSLSLDRCMGSLDPQHLPHLTELRVVDEGVMGGRDSDADSQADSHAGSDAGGDAGSDADSVADSDADSVADSQADSEADSVADSKPHWSAFHVSVGKLLPQLSALVYEDTGSAVWPYIFTPVTTTHTLTSLTVTYLKDSLLPLLLQHAPALQHIGVDFFWLDEDYRDARWGVKRVSYTGDGHGLPVEMLINLPRNETCLVHFPQVRTVSFHVGCAQLEQADYRLPEWSFPDVETVRLSNASHTSSAAITNTLSQLTHLHAPQATVLLWGEWSPKLAELVAAAPPAPLGLRNTISLGDAELTDKLLGRIVEASVPVESTTVQRLCVESDHYAAAQWPWRELHCATEVDLAVVRKLPCQPKDGVQPVIRCQGVSIDYMSEAEAERVRDQLQHIQWSLPQGGVINLESSLVGEFLHTALSVVGAVRHKDASVRRTVNLRLPPCTQLSTVHVSQLRRAVGEVSCMTFSVDTLTQADKDILQSKLQDTSAASLTVYCERFTVETLTQADADLIGATLRHVKFSNPKLRVGTHNTTPIQFRIEHFGTQAPSLPAQLSVLRAVSFTDEYNSRNKSVRFSARTLSSNDLQALQGLPHWDGCLDLGVCVFDGVCAAECVSHIPVSYREWKLGCVSREVLQSVCTAISQRRQGLGLPPVTVRTSSDQVACVEAGEHVNLVGP